MKNSIKLFPIVLGLAVTGIISLCVGIAIEMANANYGQDNTLIAKEFAVSDFTGIEFNDISDVEIIQGDKEQLVAKGPKSKVEDISATVTNGTLKVTQDFRRIYFFSFRRTEQISYTLYVKNINSIVNKGVGSLHAQQLTTDSLSLTNDGVGEISIVSLTTKSLDSIIKGTGSTSVSGTADKVTTRVEGTGSFEAFGLESKDCSAILKGVGAIEVWCKDTLDASLEGMGDITYKGEPKITQSVKGLGSINRK